MDLLDNRVLKGLPVLMAQRVRRVKRDLKVLKGSREFKDPKAWWVHRVLWVIQVSQVLKESLDHKDQRDLMV